MQGKLADIAQGARLINSTIDALKAERKEASFNQLFTEVSKFCLSKGIDVPLQSDPTSASDKSNAAKPSCRTK